jgi:hypothetical protein
MWFGVWKELLNFRVSLRLYPLFYLLLVSWIWTRHTINSPDPTPTPWLFHYETGLFWRAARIERAETTGSTRCIRVLRQKYVFFFFFLLFYCSTNVYFRFLLYRHHHSIRTPQRHHGAREERGVFRMHIFGLFFSHIVRPDCPKVCYDHFFSWRCAYIEALRPQDF